MVYVSVFGVYKGTSTDSTQTVLMANKLFLFFQSYSKEVVQSVVSMIILGFGFWDVRCTCLPILFSVSTADFLSVFLSISKSVKTVSSRVPSFSVFSLSLSDFLSVFVSVLPLTLSILLSSFIFGHFHSPEGKFSLRKASNLSHWSVTKTGLPIRSVISTSIRSLLGRILATEFPNLCSNL